jgi:hypothetical protein
MNKLMTSMAGLMLIGVLLVGIAHTALAKAEEPTNSLDLLDLQRADVAVFREKFLNVDRSFTIRTKALAEGRLRRLERAKRALTPIAFTVELCRIAALADNAHTGCLPAPLAREMCRQFAVLDGGNSTGCDLHTPDFDVPQFNRISLGFFPFGGDFNVVAAKAGNSDLLGARLLAVDGKAIENIRPVLRTFSGGTASWRDLGAAGVLVSPDQLHAAGISRHSGAVTYRMLKRDGAVADREFRPDPPGDDVSSPWQLIPAPDSAPWAFQDPAQPFRWRDAPELNAVVIQLRSNVDSDKQTIADFLEESEANRQRLGRQNVVLDMRFNGGGNLMLTRQFMMRWPSRLEVPGRFFVLTSRRTFSAGIATTAYLKQAGKERVVLVGEQPGDRLMFFSEARPVQLPHSGLFFGPSTARMDFQSGCERYTDCHFAIAQPGGEAAPLLLRNVKAEEIARIPRLPIAVSSLEPDLPAPWTLESWLAGADPAMAAVLQAIGKQP